MTRPRIIIAVATIIIGGSFVFIVGGFLVEVFGVSHSFRYRVAATTVLIDGDRRLTGTFVSDCHGRRIQGGLTAGVHIQRRGDDAHFVLRDRSILIVPKLVPCHWADPLPPRGDTVRFDPMVGDRDKPPPGTMRIYPENVWRFDNGENPSTAMLYDTSALFRLGADDIQIQSSSVALLGSWDGGWSVPRTLDDQFPWLVWTTHEDTADGVNGIFHGFSAEVTMLSGATCPGIAPDVAGPVRVADRQCDAGRDCQSSKTKTNCGVRTGWLLANPTADFASVSFSLAQGSLVRRAALFREASILAQRGPGRVASKYFFWEPRLCLDGVCTELSTERKSLSFSFYYPAQNAVVRIVRLRENAIGRFRDGHGFYYD